MRRAVLAALVVSSLALAAFASPALARSDAAGAAKAAVTAAEAEHQRILDYWTPARMANATPRDITLPLGSKPRPTAKPGSGSSTDVKGATWNGGGDVVLTTGKVFFTLNGTNYVCSGSAVKSNNRSTVLTAGHCLHNGGNNGPFATKWMFAPGYSSGDHPVLGRWTATDLYTTLNWHTKTNWYDDDAGFAVVTQGTGTALEDAIEAYAPGTVIPSIDVTNTTFTDTYFAFGYPAAKKYSGQILTYCSGPVSTTRDRYNTLSMACDMTGGSSGGPWLYKWDSTRKTGTLNSLNSYGYSSLKGYMFGPIFGSGPGEEAGAYNGANTSTGDCSGTGDFACVDLSD